MQQGMGRVWDHMGRFCGDLDGFQHDNSGLAVDSDRSDQPGQPGNHIGTL